jgi:two-component system response regulator AlgR
MICKILIVDDEALARARLRALLGDIQGEFNHEIVGEAGDGRQALAFIDKHGVDIVLLDVQMPGMNGVEVARHLAQLPQPPAVIFVTAFDEYAVKAFEVHALDYLMKPVRAQRLLEAFQHAGRVAYRDQQSLAEVALQTRSGPREFLSVHERGRMLLIPVLEILYFKAELKYVTIRTKEREYITEEALVIFEEEFSARFVRVHRNALVARSAVAGFERVDNPSSEEAAGDPHWEVVLRDVPERLPVSRRQWPIVKALLKT